ncbi:1,4-alpha-glucan branching protein [Streptomyces sp. NBC_01218]|uniref:maltokinase N-terminal cap-like domain-containing protein n=1 Tax=unclassified Streptomyces TaxID=2593676 RepID=UPI002E149D33|nr:1,4-alpha-glucan branching protein [Streptomyces sp. NBC_01218]
MAFIHRTTMTPGKLDLVAAWLPAQPWYAGTTPELSKAGGFRLDDPQGEVGIEFMVVSDASTGRPHPYHVPVTYRGAPLEGAGAALIGTSEHGVLGTRWVYDGASDPVLTGRLLALLHGRAEPQAQSDSNTPDPTVHAREMGEDIPDGVVVESIESGMFGTDILLADPAGPGRWTLRVVRALTGDAEEAKGDAGPLLGEITALWALPGAEPARARFAEVRHTAQG